jgi:hypothetical protein
MSEVHSMTWWFSVSCFADVLRGSHYEDDDCVNKLLVPSVAKLPNLIRRSHHRNIACHLQVKICPNRGVAI